MYTDNTKYTNKIFSEPMIHDPMIHDPMIIDQNIAYKNMAAFTLFYALDVPPFTEELMELYIKTHDGYQFLDPNLIEQVWKFREMSIEQLNTFFVLLRTINYFYKKIHENLIKIVMHNLGMFDNGSIDLTFFKNPNFINKFSEKLLKESDFIMMKKDCDLNMITGEIQLILDIMDPKIGIKIHSCLKDNCDKFNHFARILHNSIMLDLDILVPVGNKILNLCAKKDLSVNDKSFLKIFMEENIVHIPKEPLNSYDKDDLIESYHQFVVLTYNNNSQDDMYNDIYNDVYNDVYSDVYNDVYNDMHDDVYGTNQKSDKNYQGLEIIENNANKRLSTIGYQIFMGENNKWIHDVIDCFIEHGFVSDRKEIASLIYHAMITNRNTPGYTNKYDEMTLYDHYILISIANDNVTSFDLSMEKILNNSDIPIEFPIEIILRIISRLYNINIVLYPENLKPIFISNALTDPKEIGIYRATADNYYNIIPINEDFYPIHYTTKHSSYPKHNFSTEKTTNDITDIVEV